MRLWVGFLATAGAVLAGCGGDRTPADGRLQKAGFDLACETTGVAMGKFDDPPALTVRMWRRGGLLVEVGRVATAGVLDEMTAARIHANPRCPEEAGSLGHATSGDRTVIFLKALPHSGARSKEQKAVMDCATGKGPCDLASPAPDSTPRPRRTPRPKAPFFQVVGSIKTGTGALEPAQILTIGRRRLILRVRPRHFCSMSPAQRLSAIKADTDGIRTRFRRRGIRHVAIAVGPLRTDSRVKPYARVESDGVHLTRSGRTC